MGKVQICQESDQVLLEGELSDVISTIRGFPSSTEHLLGVMVGVALASTVSGLRDFHFQQIADSAMGDINRIQVRVALSMIDGVGWGITFLEDQKPRVIQ
jgi:phosphate/sulfate permease